MCEEVKKNGGHCKCCGEKDVKAGVKDDRVIPERSERDGGAKEH